MSNDSKSIRFRCPHCEVILRANSEEGGSSRNCPRCHKEFRVPVVKAQASKRVPEPRSDSPNERDALPVVCTVCQTRMYASEEQIGQSIECPDCFTQNLVKDVPAEKRSRVSSDEAGFGYGLQPEAQREVADSHVHALMDEADRIVEEQIESQPEIPDRPFVSGVFLFAFTGKVFPLVLGMTLSWSIVLCLIKAAWSMEGAASLLAPFLFAGSGIGLLLVTFPTLVCWQKIFELTAQGDDDSEYRPEGGIFNFVDWMMDVIPLAFAAVLGFSPGMIVARSLGMPTQYFPIVAFGASLLFPLVLLSILETASLAGVYSKPIWSSLFGQASHWLKFYLIGSLILGLAGSAIGCIVYLASRDLSGLVATGAAVALLAASLLFTTYFRLLGRHAFVLIQEIEVEDVDSDEGTADESQDAEMSLGV